ncbi:kinase-like domain-containing protein [Rhizophagus clarus]|uniref:Kinase-like domain-containing protein n=1 Tax=Rhizophagus clarus TaxID=94130 RepID=A0A8H3QMN2_9GLOM|nr:kinase-like domain-containing protein [Rhizophagus clarus]
MEFLTTDLADFGDLTAGKKIITENFKNWTSGNEIIDNFIQEKQLKYDGKDAIFKWIRYSELIDIKEIEDNCLITAILKDGLLYYCECENEWIKTLYEKVVLRFLYDLQNVVDEFTNKIESYLKYERYGISQNPDKKVYVLVFSNIYLEYYCETCGNEYKDTRFKWVFEWIPYNEFIGIEEVGKGYTAIWKNKNIISTIIHKWMSTTRSLWVISNPDTQVYILVLYGEYFKYYCENCGNRYEDNYSRWFQLCQINNLKISFTNWTSGNVKIDNFIQKKQSKFEYNIVFEWIPYNNLTEIKEIDREDGFTTAIWKDGPLIYVREKGMMRESYKKVGLKYLHDLQGINDEFLNEIESFIKDKTSYGLSKIPGTKIYILIFDNKYFDNYCIECGEAYKISWNKWCKSCQANHLKSNFTNWTSGNEKIDDFIQKLLLKIGEYDDAIFEWIPYNRFIDIKEIRKGLTYSIENSYGITQNPNIKSYMVVYKIVYNCEICGEKFNKQFEVENKSCMFCQMNHENTKISDLIQEMKSSIDYNTSKSNMIFDWIPYDQFSDIEEIGIGGFSTVYSAMWEDGLLYYDECWKRKSNTKCCFKMFAKFTEFS